MNAKYRIQYKYNINIDKTQFKMPHDAKMIQYHIQHRSHKYDIYSILKTKVMSHENRCSFLYTCK